MTYISIDGDDIGRRVTAMHLANDAAGLSAFVALVHDKVTQIGRLLENAGFLVIFCAADGVVAHKEDTHATTVADLYTSIEAIGGGDLTFSAGVGRSLREAYVALLAAKSNGKARLCIFSEMP
ncbi:mCpol domain-containing protein [Rhizobium leguminosarum]|uniref:mCpol domain-containing protein n=1 Tax=Rhizobium leguminosarum TaxID=384 RepID=UPI003F948AF4